ncbi:hypothetical protein [Mesorhizobium sp. LNJC405B00]|uniref:hypothetical protein n=1 Tax=Mesorhizobium sp. LNJC405B00 TaxID=1287281 RepID=UPI0012EC6A83|nr:hypothetical protein [Mesorhizobium sp. LNJC405B00]
MAEITTWLKPASNWRIGRMQIELAHHLYMVADYRRILVADNCGRESPEHMDASKLSDKAEHAWRIECLKQIFVPAEHVRHLRWKQDWLKQHGGGTPETALAIARDETALADRLSIVARQQAGRRKANR